jgi:rhodanese-related sulfurtransferase
MRSTRREEVRQLERRRALVEVLPREEYEEGAHRRAVNIPLKELNRETAMQLDRSRPVIVYCHDYQLDLSPRAAWRLDAMGLDTCIVVNDRRVVLGRLGRKAVGPTRVSPSRRP